MVEVTHGAVDAIPIAEVDDVELYHPKSWMTTYVFCQDAKVIAIQYSITAIAIGDRKSTRLNSSHSQISYAVFCLKKKKLLTYSRRMPVYVRYLRSCWESWLAQSGMRLPHASL